jgi:trehalose-phosphatase
MPFESTPQASTNSLIAVEGVPDFWTRIASARHVSLFLDYDGTLAPFHVDRMLAVPLPGTIEAIQAIRDGADTDVMIVSGRPVAEILALLGNLDLIIVGSHGYEVFRPDGSQHVANISPEQATILDRVYEEALGIFDPDRLERKAASVAAHFRGLDPQKVAEIETRLDARWRAIGSGPLVEYRPFNGGLELRAIGRTKGTVISEMLEIAPKDTLPVYIGDDETDEDAFGVLVGLGIGIKVGPMEAVTKADGRLPDSKAVLRLLRDWCTARNGA